jgi:hypothetical protein
VCDHQAAQQNETARQYQLEDGQPAPPDHQGLRQGGELGLEAGTLPAPPSTVLGASPRDDTRATDVHTGVDKIVTQPGIIMLLFCAKKVVHTLFSLCYTV